MAENIRTRASKGDVDLISGLGEGLEEQGSEQVIIERICFGKEKEELGKDRRLVNLTLLLGVAAQENSLLRMRNGTKQSEALSTAIQYMRLDVQNKH